MADNEQVGLFDLLEETAQGFFDANIYPIIQSAIEALPIASAELLTFRKSNSEDARLSAAKGFVLYFDQKVMEVELKKGTCYLTFADKYATPEMASLTGYKARPSDHAFRIPYNGSDAARAALTAILPQIITAIIRATPKAFDCCHLYQSCSDAKMCVSPSRAYSYGCGYQKKLLDGRIFYGKNRNID